MQSKSNTSHFYQRNDRERNRTRGKLNVDTSKEEKEIPEESDFPAVIQSLATEPQNISTFADMIYKYGFRYDLDTLRPFLDFAIQVWDQATEEMKEDIIYCLDYSIDIDANDIPEVMFTSEEFIQFLLSGFPGNGAVERIIKNLIEDIPYFSDRSVSAPNLKYLVDNGIINKAVESGDMKTTAQYLAVLFKSMRKLDNGRNYPFDINLLGDMFHYVVDFALTCDDVSVSNKLIRIIYRCFQFPNFAIYFLKNENLAPFLERSPPAEIASSLRHALEEMFEMDSSKTYVVKSGETDIIKQECNLIKDSVDFAETPLFTYFIGLIRSEDQEVACQSVNALAQITMYTEVSSQLEAEGYFEELMEKYQETNDFYFKESIFILLCSLYSTATEEQLGHFHTIGFIDLIEEAFERQSSGYVIRLIINALENCLIEASRTENTELAEVVFDNENIMEMLTRISDGEFDDLTPYGADLYLSQEAENIIERSNEF